MKFDDFDEKMRKFEQSIDQTIPHDCYMVARLDGKKDLPNLQKRI